MIPAWSTDASSGADIALGDLLAYGLAVSPQKVAILDRRQSYTFAELEALASAYASVLSERYGIRAQDRVMVLARKTCKIAALAIALWKLGAIYMPVDAELPTVRLEAMAQRARPALIVGFDTASDLPGPFADLEPVAGASDRYMVLSHRHAPDEIAYVMHTSGSTGAPKGVQISELSLKHYFRAHNAMLRFHPDARVFSLAPFHFDVSIEDTLLPLSLGASVYQYNGVPHGSLMRTVLMREQITHLIAVSTLLTLISDQPDAIIPDNLPKLEMVMTGAEICAPSVINLWASRLPYARVYNVYGPTEVTIVCAGYHISSPDLGRTLPYPIGLPLDGVQALLLDQSGSEITEADTPGELCLGGEQVMAGYLGQPEETARRIFLIDGVRYYRSGDQCTRDSEGFYHFVGRQDGEVKLNGRRINLVEVQSECLATSGVERAAVGLMKGLHEKTVIGVVLVGSTDDVCGQVRNRLIERLPSYMVPSLWGIVLGVCPGSTGKTDDRSLLAKLENDALATRRHEMVLVIEETR